MPINTAPFPFIQGKDYTRQEIFTIVGEAQHTGGDWFTGYHEHEGDFFIFCGIGSPGRTGHNYGNHFQGDELVWFGTANSRLNTPGIQRLLDPNSRVYIFFREDNRDPFTFAGLGTPAGEVMGETPVNVRWNLSGVTTTSVVSLPEEIPHGVKIPEGARKTITVNVYERTPTARRLCLAHWGCCCMVCGFDFKEAYGALGEGFIHVHHLNPLGEIGGTYLLDPIADLRPVCPNCHAMLHRQDPVLSIDHLKQLIAETKG